jgi:hypothetical protein
MSSHVERRITWIHRSSTNIESTNFNENIEDNTVNADISRLAHGSLLFQWSRLVSGTIMTCFRGPFVGLKLLKLQSGSWNPCVQCIRRLKVSLASYCLTLVNHPPPNETCRRRLYTGSRSRPLSFICKYVSSFKHSWLMTELMESRPLTQSVAFSGYGQGFNKCHVNLVRQ